MSTNTAVETSTYVGTVCQDIATELLVRFTPGTRLGTMNALVRSLTTGRSALRGATARVVDEGVAVSIRTQRSTSVDRSDPRWLHSSVGGHLTDSGVARLVGIDVVSHEVRPGVWGEMPAEALAS